MTKDKKKKSKLAPLWLLMKILLGFAIVIAIGIAVLAKVGGNSEILKNAVENYFHDATGYQAEIGTLNNLSFFPNINVDFENLELSPSNNENPVATIQKLNIRLGFWDAIAGNGRIKNVAINGLHARAGVYTQKPLTINSITITDDQANDQSAELTLDGMLGKQAFHGSTTLAAYGQGKDRTYDLGEKRTITFKTGDIILSGIMKNPSLDNIQIENLLLTQGEKKWVFGDMNIATKGKNRLIEGTLNIGKGTIIKPDILMGKNLVDGHIDFETVHIEDLSALSAIAREIMAIAPQDENKSDAIDLSGHNVDVAIKLKKIMMNDKMLGNQTIVATVKKSTLTVKADNGKFAGGDTNFTAILEPKEEHYRLSSETTLNRIPMEKLFNVLGQNIKISSQMDSAIDVQSVAKSWGKLSENLQGDITTIFEEGEFENRLLNLWGSGLGSLVLPNFNPQQEATLNCAIANADIISSLATFNTLFMDTKSVRIAGAGTYDISKDTLNISLKPQSKDLSIGDVSAGVKITGPISKPQISTDKVDLGKKAVGLLLSTVNPALFVVNNIDAKGLISNVLGVETSEQKAQEVAASLCDALNTMEGDNKAKVMAKYLKEAAVTDK